MMHLTDARRIIVAGLKKMSEGPSGASPAQQTIPRVVLHESGDKRGTLYGDRRVVTTHAVQSETWDFYSDVTRTITFDDPRESMLLLREELQKHLRTGEELPWTITVGSGSEETLSIRRTDRKEQRVSVEILICSRKEAQSILQELEKVL